jgi:hypothetical protein
VIAVLYARSELARWTENPLIDWTCLECGEALKCQVVYWQAAALLLFHPSCAARLGPHLIADSREAVLAGAADPRWRRRAIATVRRQLVAEERVA